MASGAMFIGPRLIRRLVRADHIVRSPRRPPERRTTPYWANLARSQVRQALARDARSGGREAVLAAARRGIDADPENAAAHAALADIALFPRRIAVAFDAAIRAIADEQAILRVIDG